MTKKYQHCKFKSYALEFTKKTLVAMCYSYVNDKQEMMTEEMTSLHDKTTYEVVLFFQLAIYRVMLQ